MLENITPMILTYNESANIQRSLERLSWAKQIVVVDSFSNDETIEVVRKFPRVSLLQRKFDNFAAQCNFGLQHISTDWVLSMDADYVISDELNRELAQPKTENGVAGYAARFIYCIQGRRLRASLYPPRTVLYRKSKAHYINDGHGHRVQIDGVVRSLQGCIEHDDRKPLDRWLQEQSRYARIEAEHLLSAPSTQLNFPDRLRRKIILAPFLVFFYTLIGKGLILDGWPGWFYVFQRTIAEMLLSLKLLEKKLKKRKG